MVSRKDVRMIKEAGLPDINDTVEQRLARAD
jgi:hypothetical protein